MIKIKRAYEHGLPIPEQATDGSAGFDLRAALPAQIYPGEKYLMRTGFAMAIPAGYVGIIKDRSSVASNQGLETAAGVIDSDYRGEIMVLLRNVMREGPPAVVQVGERIAQLVIVPYYSGTMFEVDELDGTERGDGGFGSTGR